MGTPPKSRKHNFREESLGPDKWSEVGWRRRPIAGAIGLRGPLLDITSGEAELLQEHSKNCGSLVEIGVFEGAAAALVREVMAEDGRLTLVDPYPPGRLFGLNMIRVVAHRAVGKVRRGAVLWIEEFSIEAADGWDEDLDFLRIDGLHNLEGVRADFEVWSPWIAAGGKVVVRQDVVPAAVGEADPFASGDEIVPWILSTSSDWLVVARRESLAVLERVSR